MATILMCMCQNGLFYYYAVHAMPTDMLWYHLTQGKAQKVKKCKLTKIQNGQHFDVLAPKWLILLLGGAYQYSFVLFSTRKSQKIRKLKMTKFKMAAILTCMCQNDLFSKSTWFEVQEIYL